MADDPASQGVYDLILQNIQTNFNGEVGPKREWYKDVVTVYIGWDHPPGDDNHSELDHWDPMTTNQLVAATNAFRMWDDFIGISLQLTEDNDADITFAYSSSTEDNGTYCSPDLGTLHPGDNPGIPGTYEIDGQDIWMSSNWNELKEASIGAIGTRGFKTMMHEIGHSLGLSHPGPYNADDETKPDYSDDAVMVQDSGQYTIMSYFGDAYDTGFGWTPPDDDPPHTQVGDYIYWQTPTMYDIAALQEKYGADLTTRADDTTYGFNASNVGIFLDIYDFSRNKHPIITIYDAGGIDTLDLSGYTGGPQHIDLRQGAYSDVMGMVNNLGIAYRANIENAIGGTGDDYIRGNALDNTLKGGAGEDTIYGAEGIDTIDGGANSDYIDAGGTGFAAGDEVLTGGTGIDTFIYSYAYLGTIITDFDVFLETIDITKQRVHNFVDLMAMATQVGLDTVIDFGVAAFGLHDKLTLQNVNIDDLSSRSFTFAESEVSAPGDFKIIANPASVTVPFYSTGAAFADGFMIVETSLTTYNGSHALMAHRFDERGVEIGTFQVNTTAFTDSGLFARALTLANGNVAVIWLSDDTGGGGTFCFRGRIFDENGVPVTENDFVINETPPVTQLFRTGWSMDVIDVVNSSSGNGFIVSWRKDIDPDDVAYDNHYYERAFDNSGNPLTGDIDVGPLGTDGVPGFPLSTAVREITLSSGEIVLWWTGLVPGDSSGVLKVMATLSGDPDFVVVGENNLSHLVSVDELPDGNVVFSWAPGTRSGFSQISYGAQTLILDADLRGFVRPGTTGDETLTGSIYNDELYGLAGNDTLIGGRGPDVLDGGEGIDTVDYSGSIQAVKLTLGSPNIQQGGHAEGDTLISIERVLGSGADDEFTDIDASDNYIFGNYGHDHFYMHSGNNTIDGGRGSDAIFYDDPVTAFEFSYDPFNKVITITPKDGGVSYGINKVSNVERFNFAGESYDLANILARAGYNDDNDPVTPEADTYRVDVGGTLAVNEASGLLTNDAIPDGDGVVVGVLWNGEYVMSIDDANMGKLTVTADGAFSFQAPASLGIFTFEYRVEDIDGSWATSTVTFNVTKPPPVAELDLYFVDPDATLTLDASEGLLANDTTPSGTMSVVGLVNDDDELVDTIVKERGTLHVNSDGSFTFTAAEGVRGSVIFEYKIMADSSEGATNTVYFSITEDNVAPRGTDKTITIKEDKAYTLTETDFGFTDARDKFELVIIDGIAGDGTLTYDGKEVGGGAKIRVENLDKLIWTPDKDVSGDGLGTIAFRVQDDGGTNGEGEDTDSIANFLTFDVIETTDVFKGKKGKDNFVGTDGHDVFDGKAGNDTFTGKGGSDTFMFKTGYDKDTVKDFDADGDDHDIIDLSGLKSISNFKDLKNEHIETHGKDIWIDGGKGDILVLKHVDGINKDLFEL